jgi:Transposase, Mutator family
LDGVQLVVCDHHEGLKTAIARILACPWQCCPSISSGRCISTAGPRSAGLVSAALREVFDAEDQEPARERAVPVPGNARGGVIRTRGLRMGDIWDYPEALRELDIDGFFVEAIDGRIGHLHESSDMGYIVVDTGTWVFGRKVLLPAGLIEGVDVDAQQIFVNRTREEIKNAPEFDDEDRAQAAHRAALQEYYSRKEADAQA